jgi:hypothetical protein
MPKLRLALLRALVLFAAVVTASLVPGAATSASPADTERGLDVWVHAPSTATGRGTVPINVLALGFPTVKTTRPLAGAVVEATWDPESLVEPKEKGKDAPPPKPAAAPPTVRATTDAEGRATLELPVPDGTERPIVALVSVSQNGKQRVREVTIRRLPPADLKVFVSETRVVPGSDVVAWLLLASEQGERPIASASLEVRLLQGGLVRFRRTVTTDPAGSAMLRVPIPRDQEPDVSWTLDARAIDAATLGLSSSPTGVTLAPREETPGKPTFSLTFDDGSVRAGAPARFRLRLRDGSDQGVGLQPVWIWSGPAGTEPPKDDKAFKAAAKRYTTDGAGQIAGEVVAPTTIPLRGTTLSVDARTELEGQPFTAKASIEVAREHGSVALTPEAGDLVPGLEQRVFVQISDDRGKPVKTKLIANGDGLDTTFATDAQGEGMITWKVPEGIGAKREIGPCPGSVAAAVRLKVAEGEAPLALGSLDAPICVGVDRGAKVILRPERTTIRAGEKLGVEVFGGGKAPISLLLASADGAVSRATWNAGEARRVEIPIPPSSVGVAKLTAALPGRDEASRVAGAAVLVLPRTLPKLDAKLAGGRAAPGGTVTVEATLTDESGKGLKGTVAAVVIDKLGGGGFGPIHTMDTRSVLCGAIGSEEERCDAVLQDGKAADIYRSVLLQGNVAVEKPVLDPAANLREGVDSVFRSVVHSLEGAVYEASMSPETLQDVRRTVGGKHSFNPELMTLVTEAMDPRPELPGGEPIALADLVAIDRQITFDNVARRVTRLKLFDALKALREFKQNEQIDPDEPILSEPNVLLKKLVREGQLTNEGLLDPWGGHLAFYKAGGEVIPFVTVARGWELRSPGPDGKLGTGDDVKSPFERVLKSGSPYAEAVQEDRVVEARFDMRVAEATVDAWGTTLRETTGTALGLGTIGTIGHGSGTGSGSGYGLGGMGLARSPRVRGLSLVAKGIYFVSKPVRTDDSGRARVDVVLGSEETTWRIALVGIPDKARAAVGYVDVPVMVPLSAKLQAGAVWTEGDSAEVTIHVRNRTDADVDATLAVAGEGAMAVDKAATSKTVKVAKQGAASVRVPVRAMRAGRGTIAVKTSAPGLPADEVRYDVESLPKGEQIRVARAVYLDRETDLSAYLTRRDLVAMGQASVVLQRGSSAVLEGALDSLSADKLTSRSALVDAIEAAGLVSRFEKQRAGDGSPLGERAKAAGREAAAKLLSLKDSPDDTALFIARVRQVGLMDAEELPKTEECPKVPEAPTAREALLLLEADPPVTGGAGLDCWTEAVARAKNVVERAESPAVLARAALALRDSPQRATQLKSIMTKLVTKVVPTSAGSITMPSGSTRADVALVYAALIAAGGYDGQTREQLSGWLLVQRDARGGFGSAAATRAAIEALTSGSPAKSGPATVLVDFGDGGEKRVSVPADGRARVDVPKGATRVVVKPDGATDTVARLERDFLRPYSVSPPPTTSGLALSVEWPADPKVGKVHNLEVAVDAGVEAQRVEVRIPLPPGATLADAVPGVRQVQGALFLRLRAKERDTTTIPIRFLLPGELTIREATATALERDASPAVERARPLRVTQ